MPDKTPPEDELEKRRIAQRQKRIIATENRAKAVEFRKMGMTYEAIGKQLNMTRQSAHGAVKKAMSEVRARQQEDAIDVKTMEIENLERVKLAAWPQAMKGSPPHMKEVRDCAKRLSEIQGVITPIGIARTDTHGRDLDGIDAMSEAEIDARIAELQGKLADDDSDSQ